MCYHILVFTVLKEQRMASSQKIHKGRCFTFIKGQRDNCLFSELNLPVLYIPWNISTWGLFLFFFLFFERNNFHIKNSLLSIVFFHFLHFRIIKIWSKYLSFSSFCSTYFSYSVQLAPLLVQPSLQPCKNKKWSYESSILQWSYNPNRDVGTNNQMGDSGDMSPPKFGQKVKHNRTQQNMSWF